jgi:Site-specific recombinase XerD
MTTRITEDILLALMQLGMTDQGMLANVKHVVQAELAKYDIKPRETAIAIRDNGDVDMVARFFVAKTSAGLSARSLKMYSTTLQRLLKRLNRNLKEVTTDDIRVMLTNMRMEGIELVSIDNDRRVLSSFFGWLYSEGFIKSNPMKRIEKVKYQKKVKKPFTEEEMEMLRINAKCDRDKAIIEFLFSTGCRVTECEQLNRNDIDFSLRECTVLGKGNKERTGVPVTSLCCRSSAIPKEPQGQRPCSFHLSIQMGARQGWQDGARRQTDTPTKVRHRERSQAGR